jgi:hypothetical protein
VVVLPKKAGRNSGEALKADCIRIATTTALPEALKANAMIIITTCIIEWVAAIACALPVCRAALADPAVALRDEEAPFGRTRTDNGLIPNSTTDENAARGRQASAHA